MSPKNAWNHWCNTCNKWVHEELIEELIAEHLQRRHGMSADAAQRAALAVMPGHTRKKLVAAMRYTK